MLNGLYLAAMGARVQDVRQDVVANNMANVGTSAYRRDQAVFRLRLPAGAERPDWADRGLPLYERIGGGVALARIAAADERGPNEWTGRPLDLAVQGEGFLKVRGPDGRAYYTRAGSLRRDQEGYLVTGNRGQYRVQSVGGDLQLATDRVDINVVGEISVEGAGAGQIALVDVDTSRLRKHGENLWTLEGDPAEAPAGGTLLQGYLEGSGVEPEQELTEMIEVQRTYEVCLRALRIQDEMLGRAVNDVGRAAA